MKANKNMVNRNDYKESILGTEEPSREYAEFQAKLTPGIPAECFIGIKVPRLREIAKQHFGSEKCELFIQTLPHIYYEENMLHGMFISLIKDYDTCIGELERFLPYVDNWAVCDTMSPVCFKKNKDKLLVKIREWIKSDHAYTCRFAMSMLMKHFLDADFKQEYLELPAEVVSEEYYVNMMIAWFFATALAKQWDFVIPILEKNRLSVWVHNKTIQKARESFRITQEQKEYLKTIKRKGE